jgi:hypothetical protein
MDKTTSITAWLHCLLKLAPPNGLLHVGAGSAGQTGADLAWLYSHMPKVLAVEARAEPFRRLQAEWAGHPHVEVQQRVVAGEAGLTMFHHASVGAESGLCAAEDLQQLWPNIRTTDIEPMQAVSLAELLLAPDADGQGPNCNWLVIDCLPAGRLLQAAGATLRSTDVVVLRALDTPAQVAADSDAAAVLQLSDLQLLLQTAGFAWIGAQEEDHPGVVRAVFARNQLAITQRLTLEVAQLLRDQAARDQVASELQAVLANQLAGNIASHEAEQANWGQARSALNAALDEQTRLASEAQAQRDALVKEKTALIAARDAQAKIASEAQAQRDALAKEKTMLIAARDAEEKVATEAQAQRDALAKEKTALMAARDAED